MFTGLIQYIGTLDQRIERSPGVVSLVIAVADVIDWSLGESVAVDGVCLTVVAFDEQSFTVDLSPETQSLTHFLMQPMGYVCHLERALRVGDRLGGHWVTGHVDASLAVTERVMQGDCCALSFGGVLQQHQSLLVPKGSVSIMGVSLTVNRVWSGGFSVMLIPKTLEVTQLGVYNVGDVVHIEYDAMAKWVTQYGVIEQSQTVEGGAA